MTCIRAESEHLLVTSLHPVLVSASLMIMTSVARSSSPSLPTLNSGSGGAVLSCCDSNNFILISLICIIISITGVESA